MGATIRRSPVISNIPTNNNNYDFLNIVDFRGLEINDNPLAPNKNSASDILNLYVDMNGTLTTRPRTERVVNLTISNKISFYFAYPLETGLLIHGSALVETVEKNKLWLYNGSSVIEVDMNGLTISSSKLGVIQKEGKIYILDGELYAVIKSDNVLYNVYNDIDTYIPTTHIGYYYPTNMVFNRSDGDIALTDNVILKTNEYRNILTNKYKQKYFWNDSINYDELFLGKIYTNNYIKDSINSYSGVILDLFKIKELSNGNVYKCTSKTIEKYVIDAEPEVIYTISDETEHYIRDVSKDGKYVIEITYDDITGELDGFDRYDLQFETRTSIDLPAGYKEDSILNVKMSENGDEFYANFRSSDDSKIAIFHHNISTNTWTKVYELVADTTSTIGEIFTNDLFDGIIFIRSVNSGDEYKLTKLTNTKATSTTVINDVLIEIDKIYHSHAFISMTTNIDLSKLAFSAEGSVYIIDTTTSSLTYKNININISDIVGNNTLNIGLTFNEDSSQLGIGIAVSYDDSKRYFMFKYMINDNSLFKVINNKQIDLENNPEHYTNDLLVLSNLRGFFIACDYLFSESFEETEDFSGFYYLEIGNTPEIELILEDSTTTAIHDLENYIRFQNNYWFYGDNNIIRYTEYNDPTYIPEKNYDEFGENIDRITSINLAAYNVLIVYKKNKIWLVTPVEIDGLKTYVSTETKTDKGNIAINASITTPLNDVSIHIANDGIYALTQISNVESSDRVVESISMNINSKFLLETKTGIFTIKYRYWTYIIVPDTTKTKIYILDDRQNAWFYWELYDIVSNMWVKDDIIYFSNKNWNIFKMLETDIPTMLEIIPDYEGAEYEDSSYFDHDKTEIHWRWVSQILPMKTINYPKQLLTTSFILTDNDYKDKYGLTYKFKVYRKLASDTSNYDISDKLNYIANVTKKTTITRFNFLQLELSNIPEDLDNNKLKLSGITFKYRLLEGSI